MQAGWMVLAAFLFASMGVCVKFASESFTSAELVFWRGLIGMVLLAAMARGRGVSLRTAVPAMHAWRSLIGVVSLGAWFYAIAHLQLATALTLNYMSSIWIAVFMVGGALLAWRPSPGRPPGDERPPLQGPLVLTVVVGFAGVVLMLQPVLGANQGLAASLGLISGFTAAFAYMQVIALSRVGEPETRTVFYFAVGSAVAGGLVALVSGFSPWRWDQAVWLPPIGVLAALGQLCMTRAYATAGSHGGTLLVANLQYSGIVFAAGYGLLLFDDHIDGDRAAGMALIIASGIAATVLRQRSLPRAPAETH